MNCVAEANATTRAPAPTLRTGGSATPVVTYALIAVNVVVFALSLLQSGSADPRYSQIFNHGALATGFGLETEYWRLLTSGFLHASLVHLAVNMFSLYIIGRDLEIAFGRARYLAIYLIGLLGGSAAVMAIEQGQTATVGASGAIYGLMGALFVALLRMKAPVTTVVVMIVINLVLSISIPNISLLGHVGGLVFGAAAAAAVLWLPTKVLPPERRTAPAMSRVGWYGLAGLAVLAIAIGGGFATF